MTLVHFSIIFDQHNGTYLPAQMLTGKVKVILDAPKILKRVKIKFQGQAHVEWWERVRRSGSTKWVKRSATEHHFKRKLILDERDENFTLQAGEHLYQFCVLVPKNIPSSYKDSRGYVSYYATAKLIIPGQVNKVKKEYFKVKNHLNLNDFPDLKAAGEVEKSKKFYFLCCFSAGTLAIRACIPRTGFTADESIPLILEIDNRSQIPLNRITARIVREIRWKASTNTRKSVKELKSFSLGSASRNASVAISERVPIPSDDFPYLENCRIIVLKHFLHITAEPAGAHCDLDLVIPITVGGVPFKSEDDSIDDKFLPPDYDEYGVSNAVCVNFEELKAKGVVLSPSSLAIEIESAEIFHKCRNEMEYEKR